MKTVFKLKAEFRRVTPSLQRYLMTEDEIKKAINVNKIKFYEKILFFQKGDYVTCCENKDSIRPLKNAFDIPKGAGFRLGKTIKVSGNLMLFDSYAVYDSQERSGIYAESIRQATKEEIENYRKSKKVNK